jgi:dipeptidase E
MKLLLTSAGIKNESIANAILDLLALPANKVKAIFVPTAANVEEGEKDWLINDLKAFQQQRYESVDIIDIAAVPKDVWLPRLEAANLICFGGGNEQFLARIMHESGFNDVVRDLLKDRLYMGISAGSMVAGKYLSRELLQVVYPEDSFKRGLHEPLGLVDCTFIPHLNSVWFPQARKEVIESLTGLTSPLYALDDESALRIIDGNIEVVTEGTYIERKL